MILHRKNCIMGIDAGLGGAVAVYDPYNDQLVCAWDMPVLKILKDRREFKSIDDEKLDSQIADACAEYKVQLICLEKVAASQQMSPSSAFNFGVTYGVTRRICTANCLRVELVSPQKWKPRMMLNNDKKVSLAIARKTFGNTYFTLEKHDGRAEAALLAKYATAEYLDIEEEDFDPLS